MSELLATACSGLFAGAAIYISLVQQPAARAVGDPSTAAFFPHMYRRAAPLQAGLALVGTICGVVAWLGGSGMTWLVGAILLGAVVPFTLLVIKPTNDRLLDPTLEHSDEAVPGLLDRWAVLHGARSAASTAAFLLFLIG